MVCALKELGSLVQSLSATASPLIQEPSVGETHLLRLYNHELDLHRWWYIFLVGQLVWHRLTSSTGVTEIHEVLPVYTVAANDFLGWICSHVKPFSLPSRTPWNSDFSAAAPQHGRSSGGCMVFALCCRGTALSADPAVGPLCGENQQPQEFAWSRERLQLCNGCSTGRCASVSAGYPSLKGKGVWPPCLVKFRRLGLELLQWPDC